MPVDPTVIAAAICVASQLIVNWLAFAERRNMAQLILENVTDPKAQVALMGKVLNQPRPGLGGSLTAMIGAFSGRRGSSGGS